jgi:putative two-component system response regulator
LLDAESTLHIAVAQRVLIVDDNPDDIEIVERFLEDSGVAMLAVSDPSTVEDAFKQFEPDIVLLDLHMPGVDGLEILRRLRGQRSELGFVPVVVLTGDAGKVARNSALVLGADDFLTKPLDRQEVVLRVRNLLRTRQLYVELTQANKNLQRELNQPT